MLLESSAASTFIQRVIASVRQLKLNEIKWRVMYRWCCFNPLGLRYL